jgi:hypothetical protein
MAFKSLSQATMVKRGFGQVEPNHLSARFTGEIYAQMPAAKDINVLEQGQFVKYDYANRAVNFTGAGEWMLVYNEIKLYRDWETDEDFAMIKRDYNAYVYSPLGQNTDGSLTEAQLTKNYNSLGQQATGEVLGMDPDLGRLPVGYSYDREVMEDPAMMPEGTVMVPRVFKTHEGDIFTTNTINAKFDDVKVGDFLKVGEKGILEPGSMDDAFVWQIVKKYTMPDLQPAVKVMRVK